MTESAPLLQPATPALKAKLRTAALGLVLAGSAAFAQPSAPQPPQRCSTLEQCLAAIRDARVRILHVDSRMDEWIAPFGTAAVDALVPMLMDPDPALRERAGYLLASFRQIEPRHLPAMVHAWRHGDTTNRRGRGNGWLPRAIAATGTNEALRLLWTDFQRDPRISSNAQVLMALARFGDRLRPLVQAEMETCSVGWLDRCHGIVDLLGELDGRWPRPMPPVIPPWGVELLIGWTHAEAPDAQRVASATLGHLVHPAALEPLQRELTQLAIDPAERGAGWEAQRLIGQIERYGAAAVDSGPAIVRYLDGRFDEDLRADAALALGRIEDRTAIPALLALESELTDDWLLAYNVAESLGRLGARQARPLLERLRGHWHRAVRNNAARALNAIAGGAFGRPEEPEGSPPYPVERDGEGSELLYFGALRYAGDNATDWCGAPGERTWTLEQTPLGSLRWPSRGSVRIALDLPSEAFARAIRQRIPVQQVQGQVVAALPVRSGHLVAFNGGEFGGGVYHIPPSGPARPLTEEPVDAAWLMGGRLFVAAGLAHLVLDTGHLYVIDPETLNVQRIVRLPASPRRFAASSRRAVIIETSAGDVAVRADGSVVDPEQVSDCED